MKIKHQKTSVGIWETKYQLKDKKGKAVDKTIADTYKRVAKAIARIEKESAYWEKKFLWALENGAIPAGRIMANAGAEAYKPETSTINCTVSATIPDSMEGILNAVKEAGLTLKAGCGIGYEFSTLRPNGAFVRGAGASTSGPLSFMDIFDRMCNTVSSAGGRRGAQMGTFDISHPDVMDFIRAKREDGRLRQFNLSVLITKDFMEAVKNDEDWALVFPAQPDEMKDKATKIVWKHVANAKAQGYEVNEDGLTPCRVYKTIKARRLWDVIMRSTYDYADPGFLLIDEANRMNNNWFCEEFRASNPCGEQFLPENGACLLGSVNLTHFVKYPFTDKAQFDWVKFKKVVSIFTRMLDNVVEINGLPLEQQRNEILNKRRHGMGFLGLGSALTMMGIKYGSKPSLEFTGKVAYTMAVKGLEEGIRLAKEKGQAPIFGQRFTVDNALKAKAARLGLKLEDADYAGKTLWWMGQYVQRLFNAIKDDDLDGWTKDELEKAYWNYGCRFTHHTSIAPTGTISLSLANNASNGIEPSFAHHYSRNVIVEGKKSKEKMDVFSFELLAYRELVNPNAMPFAEDEVNQLPDYFVSAGEVTPQQHIDVQAAAQYWVDSAISKTCNVATEIPYKDFQDIYMYAYEKGLKGCTTFRFNPEAHQGVLVKEDDLAKTEYTFTLEDGSKVTLKGNEEVEYAGEVHTAANLFDALKEGWLK